MVQFQSPSSVYQQPLLRPAMASNSGVQPRPINPLDMIFNFSRYLRPDQKIVVLGRDILADSTGSLVPPQPLQVSSPPTRNVFSWDKLVAFLETGLQFDDFRESLVINYHHMAGDEAELNEGMQWYRRNNEVVVAKVDSVGNPPAGLVARMKKERKVLRQRVV